MNKLIFPCLILMTLTSVCTTACVPRAMREAMTAETEQSRFVGSVPQGKEAAKQALLRNGFTIHSETANSIEAIHAEGEAVMVSVFSISHGRIKVDIQTRGRRGRLMGSTKWERILLPEIGVMMEGRGAG